MLYLPIVIARKRFFACLKLLNCALTGSVIWKISTHAKLTRDRCALVKPGKRKRSCPFSSSKRRQKKANKSFNQECEAILAASDRGSYYNQQEWLEEVEDHVNKGEVIEQTVDQMRASSAKIQLNEGFPRFILSSTPISSEEAK